MNLLLLLSALLSALGGVTGSVRTPQVAVAAGIASAQMAQARVTAASARPVADAPVLVRTTAPLIVPSVVREAIWAGRRRE